MLCQKLTIRPSTPDDRDAIHDVESRAFGRDAEANLVDQLIPAPDHTISLVAVCDGKIIGHVLLTEITAPVKAMALAPLAVAPAYREMQVGSSLVRQAIGMASGMGYAALFVLGDTNYYRRFGFSSSLADPFDIEWQGKHFMALELLQGALKGKSGRLAYPEPFYRV